jgi:protein associated with RNAse G/E
MKSFKLGDVTRAVWAGDLASNCEFVCKLSDGNLLFYDIDSKIFRKCFWELLEEWEYDEGEERFILNGWNCAQTIHELLKTPVENV